MRVGWFCVFALGVAFRRVLPPGRRGRRPLHMIFHHSLFIFHYSFKITPQDDGCGKFPNETTGSVADVCDFTFARCSLAKHGIESMCARQNNRRFAAPVSSSFVPRPEGPGGPEVPWSFRGNSKEGKSKSPLWRFFCATFLSAQKSSIIRMICRVVSADTRGRAVFSE